MKAEMWMDLILPRHARVCAFWTLVPHPSQPIRLDVRGKNGTTMLSIHMSERQARHLHETLGKAVEYCRQTRLAARRAAKED